MLHRAIRIGQRGLVAFLLGATLTTGAAAELFTGLVGYYPFDGHFDDASGSPRAQDASVGGGAPSFASGKFGQAVYLRGNDGHNDYLTLGNPPHLQFGTGIDFTITLWIQLPEDQSQDNDGSSYVDAPTFGNKDWASRDNTGYIVSWDRGDDWFVNAKGEGGSRVGTSTHDVAFDTWHFIAATFDRDGNITVFQDGTAVATTVMGQGAIDAGWSTNIGQDGTGAYAHSFWGYLDDLAIWRRSLDASEIAEIFQAGQQGAPLSSLTDDLPMPKLYPPYVEFADPHTAVAHWASDTPCDAIVEYGRTAALGSRREDNVLSTEHRLTLPDLQWRTKYHYRLGYRHDGIEHFTPVYEFDNAINFSVVDCSGAVSPYETDALTPRYEAAAEAILEATGIRKGYCLVYGCGEGRLAFELAKRSDLILVGVTDDADEADAAARNLMAGGVYGSRVKVRYLADLSRLPFSRHFANLVVSDDAIARGALPGTAAELFRVLRPCGGKAFLGQPSGCLSVLASETLTDWLDQGSLVYSLADESNGVWAALVRGPLPDTGWWSHQYGGPHNNGTCYDSLEGATRTDQMQVQWLGRPGADSGIDRNPRMPAPVSCNGRLFHQGLNRIMALDAYNGAMLWSLEVPHLRRVNMPRDAGNVCADEEALYLAVNNECWRLDGDTGNRSGVHRLSKSGYDWGCVFRYGDKLYGSGVKSGSSFTNFWGGSSSGWYDATSGEVTYKVCSDYLFANDPQLGSRHWTYENGVIINTTLCLGADRVYFVENRNVTVKNHPSGRIGLPELWTDQYLVALSAADGLGAWEVPLNTADGTVVFYMMYAPDDILLIASSGNHGYQLNAYDASQGASLWSATHDWYNDNHGGHMQRPVIIDSSVFYVPREYDLLTGEVRGFSAGNSRSGCATYAASTGALLYRGSGGRTSMEDVGTGALTQWERLRTSCWLNFTPAGGRVLNPEGAGGCSCNGWINTSLGFAKKP
jgi:SAM-dependent methyltransferase